MDEEIVTDAVKILAPDSLKTFVDTFRLLKKIFLGRFTADVRLIWVIVVLWILLYATLLNATLLHATLLYAT